MNTLSDLFEIIFDGEAVEDNSIDARDLAGSILSLGDLIDRASLLTEGSPRMALRVKSGFKPGSFEVAFEIGHKLIDLFSSKNTTAVVNILQILGFTGGVFGLVQFIRKARRRNSDSSAKKEILTIERQELITVHFDDGESMDVPQQVFRLYDDMKAREAAEKFVSPLKEEGIDEIRLRYQGEESVVISDQEVDYFDAPDDSDTIKTENENQMILIITNISFIPGAKWRVSDGGATPFFVSILDEDFLNQVVEREILFGANDRLQVILRTTQEYRNGKLRIDRDVVKVIKHLPSDQQGELDFS